MSKNTKTRFVDDPVRPGPNVRKLEPASKSGPQSTKIGTAAPKYHKSGHLKQYLKTLLPNCQSHLFK